MDGSHAEGDLPRLRIVSTKSLVPHEEHDMQRSAPLVERLRSEGVLKNPPIVAMLEDQDRYVILDGTNRALALGALSFPHVIVQVVDYDDPRLILDTWFHLVTDMGCDDLLRALGALGGVRIQTADLLHARAELARRQVIAAIITPDPCGSPINEQTDAQPVSDVAASGSNRVHVVYVDGDARRRADALKELVGVYESRGQIHRVVTDHLGQLMPYYDKVTALVVFPRYTPSEIMELAQQGAYLPSGLTRHVVPGRALRINFPLDVLSDGRSLEEKNIWLREWIRTKLASKDIRYYQESTYLFDE